MGGTIVPPASSLAGALLGVLNLRQQISSVFFGEIRIDRPHPIAERSDVGVVDCHAFGFQLFERGLSHLLSELDLVVLKCRGLVSKNRLLLSR